MIEKERRNELSCEMLILKSNYKLPEVYGNRMIEEQVECQRFDEWHVFLPCAIFEYLNIRKRILIDLLLIGSRIQNV